MIRLIFILSLFFSLVPSDPAQAAVQPHEVLLIANGNVAASRELAAHYQGIRNIPAENLLFVDLPDREVCTRGEYEKALLEPLRRLLAQETYRDIRCLLLFYGMPLRIASQSAPEDETLSPQRNLRSEDGAAVDSELVLARFGDYPLAGWLANPHYVPDATLRAVSRALLVARLDAARPETVRRMIRDSLAAERQGLQGRAYFDARWSLATADPDAYQRFDEAIHRAAQLTGEISTLPVTLDEKDALLAQGEDAAIYCGWYRLANYDDVFRWRPGAIGYHVASGECTSLKNPDNRGWCKGMLEAGAAATIGSVAEPYLAAFPAPDRFFEYLLNGYYTLVESYFYSLPYVSWQMVLIGDPLYRPFRNH